MAKGAAKPREDPPAPPIIYSSIFKTGRQIFLFALFALWFCVDVSILGLVSQQIHRYGGQNIFDWPTAESGHAMGLLLFASIFGLIFCLFHWFLGPKLLMVVLIINGVFWGTGAGIIYTTPYGHALQCRAGPDNFTGVWRTFYSDCTRWTAIEGLSWTMFALSLIAFFFTLFDTFEFHTKRHTLYDVERQNRQEMEDKRGLTQINSNPSSQHGTVTTTQ